MFSIKVTDSGDAADVSIEIPFSQKSHIIRIAIGEY